MDRDDTSADEEISTPSPAADDDEVHLFDQQTYEEIEDSLTEPTSDDEDMDVSHTARLHFFPILRNICLASYVLVSFFIKQ